MNPSAVPTTAAPVRRAAGALALRLTRPPLWLLLAALAALLALAELRSSRLQAALAARVTREISFPLEAGKSRTTLSDPTLFAFSGDAFIGHPPWLSCHDA